MSDKPRRAWFQIHLSTAIVLMFVASGLMWANMRAVPTESWLAVSKFAREHPLSENPNDRGALCDPSPHFEYGFPSVAYSSGQIYFYRANTFWSEWSPRGIATNSCVVIVLLATVAFISEWLVRRREARAP